VNNDVIGILTAVGSVITASGVLLAVALGYLNRRASIAAKERSEDAALKATEAASKASEAADLAAANQREIVVIHGEVVEVGKRIDGRLSELLKSTSALSRAEGRAEGEQSQRDRSAPPEKNGGR
jgi:hypothetical protein